MLFENIIRIFTTSAPTMFVWLTSLAYSVRPEKAEVQVMT
jgi:hypothetical protein